MSSCSYLSSSESDIGAVVKMFCDDIVVGDQERKFHGAGFLPPDQVIIVLLIHQGFEGLALRGGYCHMTENTQLII